MELKRQQNQSSIAPTSGDVSNASTQKSPQTESKLRRETSMGASGTGTGTGNASKSQKRVRGRRSSKPLMEKRRRARINQCLDILKSYVLTDSSNLSELGIDTMSSENQDEETIARKILKSSGLIHRHRGRKNPNKLEKADILELTVDYVRRLHEQRDQWMTTRGQGPQSGPTIAKTNANPTRLASNLSSPLSIDMKCVHNSQSARMAHSQAPCLPSPPPSSASSSPQPLLSISNYNNIIQAQIHNCGDQFDRLANQEQLGQLGDVLDLTKRSTRRLQRSGHIQTPNVGFETPVIYADGYWRPWYPPSRIGDFAR